MFLNSTYTHPGHREKLIATITLLMIIDEALTKVSCIPYCYWISYTGDFCGSDQIRSNKLQCCSKASIVQAPNGSVQN
uniref:Uncharacterized protein n=1 Tax=Amphimedon queenslandica TaxID=400682 RepID=A0A1X7TE93_AMPQE